jgi:hypothetical protein
MYAEAELCRQSRLDIYGRNGPEEDPDKDRLKITKTMFGIPRRFGTIASGSPIARRRIQRLPMRDVNRIRRGDRRSLDEDRLCHQVVPAHDAHGFHSVEMKN